ncbi:hypothetical protein I7I50_05353 [Histoplasma capsulatum G186AR]|uniref:Uncharacterized protein n=1 Tax=Ajellomyces capsulatus TaxID=5037 RepID=A0A8H8D8W2_AJECA|nr:hypothetical protein I7I52_03614 [Histoplasma capsulatum]QSS76031.1 hypothetical protein I7I50_05353 [Histoplasma capsulatum G186AR]
MRLSHQFTMQKYAHTAIATLENRNAMPMCWNKRPNRAMLSLSSGRSYLLKYYQLLSAARSIYPRTLLL